MFNLVDVHSSWQPIIVEALANMDQNYLTQLKGNNNWLPGSNNIFNAFKLPLSDTQYILFGESPYPRKQSANGYAFWDAAVKNIWSDKGMSSQVNRATSLRNFIKMLLVTTQQLNIKDTSQNAIANINKSDCIANLSELFENMLQHGFLLLNASLTLSSLSVSKESKYWQPFISSLLSQLTQIKKNIQLILLGNIAKKILALPPAQHFSYMIAEHPYNTSFISNEEVHSFFKPFNLLNKHDKLVFS